MFEIPMKHMALLVFAFLLLVLAPQYTSRSPSFIILPLSPIEHLPSRTSKVATLSSSFLLSMSGGPVANLLTTGALTIPAMRRTGFSRQYAAGVEACASTVGVLMPPIMGATAFIMASFLGISYVTVAVAALLPSLLYFYGLFIQIDAYAARHDL